MALNKIIVIQGRSYPVNFIEAKCHDPQSGMLSYVDYTKGTINILDSMRQDPFLPQLVLKSIIQAITIQLNIGGDYSELTTLSSTLSRVLVDNKGLAQFLAGIDEKPAVKAPTKPVIKNIGNIGMTALNKDPDKTLEDLKKANPLLVAPGSTVAASSPVATKS